MKKFILGLVIGSLFAYAISYAYEYIEDLTEKTSAIRLNDRLRIMEDNIASNTSTIASHTTTLADHESRITALEP